MKKVISILVLISTMQYACGQKETFDLASYISPKGWKKQTTDNAVQYMTENKAKGTYCIIMLLKSVPGTAVSKDNFDMAWESIVKEMVSVSEAPQMQPSATEDGWELQSGVAPFQSDSSQGIVLLVTATGFEKMVNAVILTNSDAYEKKISAFLESITLQKPVTTTQPMADTKPEQIVAPAAASGFAFTTTNFDDGWTSVEKADWVEVTKGDAKVILHYPTDAFKAANTDVPVMCEAAWNYLVAPRYQSIQDYKTGPSVLDYERPYYAEATLTENGTGKSVFVVLFKKGTGWLEFVMPSRESFIQTFGVDISKIDYYADSDIWNKMKVMANYNRFAVAATDFKGTWKDRYSANTYYANIYTGMSAGMSTYSSTQTFEFLSDSKYKWDLVAINSYGGTGQYASAKSDGTFKVVNNWQIYFSDIERKPKTYNAYFSCVKGSRILWIDGSGYVRE